MNFAFFALPSFSLFFILRRRIFGKKLFYSMYHHLFSIIVVVTVINVYNKSVLYGLDYSEGNLCPERQVIGVYTSGITGFLRWERMIHEVFLMP